MSEEPMTGPKLFDLGNGYLAQARETMDKSPGGCDYHGRDDDFAADTRASMELAVALAAVASACFAGAQAAAMAVLGAEEVNDDALANEWRRIAGDKSDDEVASEQAAEDRAVSA